MKRSSAVFAVAMALATSVYAQIFNFRRFGPARDVDVSGVLRLVPADVVVGEQCSFVLELEVEKDVGLEDLNVSGLPDAEGGERVEYGPNFENLPDGKSSKPGRVVKRMELQARFLSSCTQDIAVVVQGMAAVRRQQGGMSMTSSSSFRTRLPTFHLQVDPLPDIGRPSDFSGAIGSGFKIAQTLSPDHVHPGDLVTATYTLSYDGYCPTNFWPAIERLPDDFKAYEPKVDSRTPGKIVWTQVLVPQTPDADRSANISVCYYNVRTKRYERTQAVPQRLVFVSDEAASTKNTAIVVTETKPGNAGQNGLPAGVNGTGPIVLRIAPSDSSPAVTTVPPGTPVVERARVNGWRRLESPNGIGWAR